ncbi:MAG: hypothetical protein ACP5RH_22070, partial [Leptodesmis sp.]|uniref:hypothetical protein n=1 Tax=Leptodesmis sp. TaxID=3100501 RepID=UPI003D0B2114
DEEWADGPNPLSTLALLDKRSIKHPGELAKFLQREPVKTLIRSGGSVYLCNNAIVKLLI